MITLVKLQLNMELWSLEMVPSRQYSNESTIHSSSDKFLQSFWSSHPVVESRKILQALSRLFNYLTSSSTLVCGTCRLWWTLTCHALWVYSDVFKVLPSVLCPHPSSLSKDKSSVSRPTGLEKLLTVDCLFGFVNASALEKGRTEE